MNSDISVAGEAAGVGFDGSFSRNCEQIFQAARMGAFLTMAEFRQNLRIAGMVLGPDEIETPEFHLPEFDPVDDGDVLFDDEDADDLEVES